MSSVPNSPNSRASTSQECSSPSKINVDRNSPPPAPRGRLYREQKKIREAKLLKELRKIIQELIVRRDLLEANHWRTKRKRLQVDHSIRVITMYASYFQHGLFPVGTKSHWQQLVFLQRIMTPTVQLGVLEGVQHLVNQWECYSMCHRSFHFELKTLAMIPVDQEEEEEEDEDQCLIVRVTCKLKGKICLETFEHIFPLALKHHPSLVSQLIGRQVCYQVVSHFFFTARGQIYRCDAEVDFLTAFCQVCDYKLDQVNLLMEDARILSGCIIGNNYN